MKLNKFIIKKGIIHFFATIIMVYGFYIAQNSLYFGIIIFLVGLNFILVSTK